MFLLSALWSAAGCQRPDLELQKINKQTKIKDGVSPEKDSKEFDLEGALVENPAHEPQQKAPPAQRNEKHQLVIEIDSN